MSLGVAPGIVPPATLARPCAAADAAAPAGFWRRYLAYSLDWLLLAPVLGYVLTPPLADAWAAMRSLNSLLQDWLLAKMLSGPGALPSPASLAQMLIHDPTLLVSVDAASVRLTWALAKATLLGALTAAIYFIGFEASVWQATPGKRLLGITVVDLQVQRIGWRRASARFLAGSLNWLSLNLGHALSGWRPDGRALHDLIAGTNVVARSPMPRWGRWLLYAQAVLLLGLIVGLLGRLLWLLAQVEHASLP